MSKKQELSDFQAQAYQLVHEGGPILESELPDEYHREVERIKLYEIGVCSECRHTSGCLRCDEAKCLGYYMRVEAKRTGRVIRDECKL